MGATLFYFSKTNDLDEGDGTRDDEVFLTRIPRYIIGLQRF